MITNSNLKALGFVKRSEVAAASALASETLAAYADTLHYGTVVAVKIYDTSRDNDGGAWRKKCAGKSYYTEPTCDGKWLGRFATDKEAIMASATYGPNLVTNPYYTNGTTGWSSVNASLSVVGNSLRTTVQGSGGEAYCVIPSVIGKVYRISLNFSVPTNTMSLSIGNAANGTVSSSFTFTLAGNNTYVAYHRATTTSFSLIATLNTSTPGRTFDISSVNVCESIVGEGDYCQLSDTNFYKLSNSAAATIVYRGGRKEFPAQVAIVAEADRVVIYDLTAKGCPMWIVLYSIQGVTWATALNGTIYIAFNNGAGLTGGLIECNFIADFFGITRRALGNVKYAPNKVSAKTPTMAQIGTFGASEAVVSGAANHVAVAVVPGSPVDPNTNLPVPTIAISTNAGISVINTSGVIYNITCTNASYSAAVACDFTENYELIYALDGVDFGRYFRVDNLPTADVSIVLGVKAPSKEYYPDFFAGDLNVDNARPGGTRHRYSNYYFAKYKGIAKLKRLPLSPNKGMVAYITGQYNTGWLVGDIRLSAISDNVAETLAASGELVVNGTFNSDISGWTDASTAPSSVTWSGGTAILNSPDGSTARLRQTVPVVIGKSYVITVSGTSQYTVSSTSAYSADLAAVTTSITVPRTVVATTASLFFSFTTVVNGTTVDNVSVKLAAEDYSGRLKGLLLNGTLTKTAANGTSSATFVSGFSASNNLEQLYDAILDYGTGDFCYYGWANVTTLATLEYFFSRGTVGGPTVSMYKTAANFLAVSCSATAAAIVTTFPLVGLLSNPLGITFLMMYRKSGMLYVYANGSLVYSGANTENVTNTSASLKLGVNVDYSSPYTGGLSMFRSTATAPTTSQVAQIYADELEMFQANTVSTIPGTLDAMSYIASDPVTNMTHFLSDERRVAFKGLVLTENETLASMGIPNIRALDARNGIVLVGSSSSCRIAMPAVKPRNEHKRRGLSKDVREVFYDTISFTSPTTSDSPNLTASSVVGTPYVGMGVTGTGIPAGTTLLSINGTAYVMSANATVTNAGAVALAQSTYSLPTGYTTKYVFVNDLLKRAGSTKDYVIYKDGYREIVNFFVSPGASTWAKIGMTQI